MPRSSSVSSLCCAVLAACVFVGCSVPNESSAAPEPVATSAVTTAKPELPAPQTVSLLAAGDNLIHSSLYKQAYRYAAAKGVDGYDFAPLYEQVAALIEAPDIAILNQETPIAGAIAAPSTYPMFNSPVELGRHMVDIGFDVFNHANNHILDKGEKGVLATLDFWDTLPEATVVGAYRDEADRDNIRTREAKGVSFSFLGFTYGTNGLTLPEGSSVQVIRNEDEARIEAQVKAADALSDIVVVSIHWGTEDSHTITDAQRILAQKMVDWGADIILGTHPHVLQNVEFLTREADGFKALVVYSLGNFISAQSRPDNLIGGLLDFDVTKTWHEDGSATLAVTRAGMIPVVTQYEASYANVRVIPVASYTEELARAHGLRAKHPKFSLAYVEQVLRDNIDPAFLPEELRNAA